jgi:tripartite-type tricarboxylate transporter receptor subunit TctC
MPGGNLKELVDWLRANPDKATAGTGGVAGAEHLAGLMFQNVTGTRFQFIPYRGSGPAVQDMLSDQIDMIFGSPIVTLPHIQAGRLKAHAIMAKSRLATLPDVPTVDEAGAPGAYNLSWLSLWAPKGTAKNIIARLSSAVTVALADSAVKVRFAGIGGRVSLCGEPIR